MRIEEKILNSSRTIAVVGLSSKPDRPSYKLARYLGKQGYNMIAMNLTKGEILGLNYIFLA